MRNFKAIEFCVGLFIIAAVLAMFYLAFKVSGVGYFGQTSSYSISANFDNVGGLKPGASVSLAGVDLGKVTSITLDPITLRAQVHMQIYSKFNNLPADSSASIMTHGILGSNYVEIGAGFLTTSLHNGSEISDTHSALILENIIGQLLFSLKDNSSPKGQGD
jgi:phospholipid/cholesterol/gamma-HCH transport system substrate-binding protein